MNVNFTIHLKTDRSPRIALYLAAFARELSARSGVSLEETDRSDNAQLVLDIAPGIGAEGYRIENSVGGAIQLTGNDELGLLYGLGKVLHDGRFGEGSFEPGDWRGVSVPRGLVRGMYFAFHSNWYDHAPLETVKNYIEELALWGMNSLVFHLAGHNTLDAAGNPGGEQRGRAVVIHARALGLQVGVLSEPNIAVGSFPPEIAAPEFPDTTPPRRGFSGNRVCISNPTGFELMSKQLDRYLAAYDGIGLDFAVAFPYDAGGCGCAQCWPWGAKGYIKISKEFSRLAKKHFPASKFVLGTWCYDVCEQSDGEYEGLEKALAQDKSWVDYIMADSHEEFPRYALQPGALAGLPIINFAEISMWGRFPWGGSGANPYPGRLQTLWDEQKQVVQGGFPYSEGNFDDINKVVCFGFFWDPQRSARESVHEYARYEFGPEVAESVTEALMLMGDTITEYDRKLEDVQRVYDLVTAAHQKLRPAARDAWRWQIVYWRAIIDFERAAHPGTVTDRCDAAYEKLIEVLYLHDGWRAVTPPSRAYLARHAAKEAAQSAEQLEAELPGAAPR